MLAEALVYALSFPATPKGFRPQLFDAVGLWARGRRRSRPWAPHLAQTRDLLLEIAGALQSRRTAVILGSGPLFDVPLEALAQSFERVLLVDQAHLVTTAVQVRRCRNAERQWRDLSPAANSRHLAFLGEITGLDWVVSLNLLSQLGLATGEKGAGAAMAAHLAALAQLPCPATLVTDVEYRIFGRDGTEAERFDQLRGLAMPPADRHWAWEVAPFGEEAAHRRRIHSVRAWLDWRKSAGGQQ